MHGWDNRSSSCTRDSARQPRDANVRTGSLDYDVYPANGTRDSTSQLSSFYTSSVTKTRPRQVFRRLHDSSMQHAIPQQMYVTHRHSYLHQTHSRYMGQQFFKRLSNCDAPSQLISLVLITATVVLHYTRTLSARCYLSHR